MNAYPQSDGKVSLIAPSANSALRATRSVPQRFGFQIEKNVYHEASKGFAPRRRCVYTNKASSRDKRTHGPCRSSVPRRVLDRGFGGMERVARGSLAFLRYPE